MQTISDGLSRDLRWALRQILRRPGFALLVVLTLAVGIGPNVAIFSVLKALVIQPFYYPEPDRLVQVWETDIAGRWNQPFTSPDYYDIREQSASFREFGVYTTRVFNLSAGEAVRVQERAGRLAVDGLDDELVRTPAIEIVQPHREPGREVLVVFHVPREVARRPEIGRERVGERHVRRDRRRAVGGVPGFGLAAEIAERADGRRNAIGKEPDAGPERRGPVRLQRQRGRRARGGAGQPRVSACASARGGRGPPRLDGTGRERGRSSGTPRGSSRGGSF
jgi:hypothetical protein